MTPTFSDIYDLKFRGAERWAELEACPVESFGPSCYWHFHDLELAQALAEGVRFEPRLVATVRFLPAIIFEDDCGEEYGLVVENPSSMRVSQISSLKPKMCESVTSTSKILRRRDQFLLRIEGFPRFSTLFVETLRGTEFRPELMDVSPPPRVLKESSKKHPGPVKGARQALHPPGQFGSLRRTVGR